MTRNLKIMGVALIAAFALGAVAASAASAEIFVFTSTAETSALKGQQTGTSKITVDAGALSCEVGKFTGEQWTEAAFEVTLSPSYEKCTLAGVSGTEVAVNGCHYVVTVVGIEGSKDESEAAVECEEGKSITVTAKVAGITKCTVHIGPQEGLKSVTVANSGSPSKVNATLAITGLKYSQTAGTGLGACATAEGTANGTYESTVAVGDFEGEAEINLLAEPAPETVKIKANPIKFAGAGSKAKVEIENVVNEPVTIHLISGPGKPGVLYKIVKGCAGTKLAKKGEICTAEVECVKATKNKGKIGVVTLPPFGATTSKLEGC
jgi:hypothetical protein